MTSSILPCDCTSARLPGTHGACFNSARTHRYAWWNRWSDAGLLVSLMLNPSTADEHEPDRTVSRNIEFARSWGLGGLEVVNAFSLRSTDPTALAANVAHAAVDPLAALRDALTDAHIAVALTRAEVVLVGWGTHLSKRPLLYRVRELRAIVGDRSVVTLVHNRDGSPKHPLYVKGKTTPVPFRWP